MATTTLSPSPRFSRLGDAAYSVLDFFAMIRAAARVSSAVQSYATPELEDLKVLGLEAHREQLKRGPVYGE